MADNRDQLIHRIAAELDKPSIYMGGPSLSSKRKAALIVDVLPDHLDAGASGACRALPGEGTGMSGVEGLAEQLAVAEKALEEIGGLGGPLYLLQPNQGERPDPVAAGTKLREILDRYWGAA